MTIAPQNRRGRLRPSASRHARRGSVLVEFAMIALVSYILLAGMLTFGLMMFQASTIQQAVDAGAQELARMPLPADAVLGLNLNTAAMPPGDNNTQTINNNPSYLFNQQIYDEQYLYVSASAVENSGLTFSDYASQNFPLINRLLSPAMIYDPELSAYRYPGAVVENGQTGHTTVLVPIVNYSTSTITWVMPVEEVLIPDSQGNYYSQFNATWMPPDLVANSQSSLSPFQPGFVALRINYPSQSASMSGFEQPANPGDPTMGNPISADDSSLADSGSLGNYTLVIGDNDGYQDGVPGIHGGKYGLGRQLAYAQQLGIRPYREVISVQAIYRREAFQ